MAKRMPKTCFIRECSVDECHRPRQARGYCITHYSQWQRSQPGYKRKRRRVQITCEYCGTIAANVLAEVAKVQRYCGLTCAARAKTGLTHAEWLERERRRVALDIYTGPPYQRPTPTVIGKGLWTSGQCQACLAWFVSDVLDVTCSPDCRDQHKRTVRRMAKDRRRARKREAYVADVYRAQVFALDGYRCHLCGTRCDNSQKAPHPKAPTVDHVIPLAAGGTHEPANCRTACFHCNSTKGDRGGGEQFALVLDLGA